MKTLIMYIYGVRYMKKWRIKRRRWGSPKNERSISSFPPPLVFPKNYIFMTVKIIINHIFPEKFIEIRHIVQKIWKFCPSALTILIDFSDFPTFPSYKETNDVTCKRWISAIFQFQLTINRFSENCLKLYWY